MAQHENLPGLEEVRFHRDEDLGGLEIRLARYKRFAFGNHWHDCYSIGAALDGGSRCIGDSDSTVVRAGQLALINPGQVHSGVPVCEAGITYLMFYVEPVIMRRLAAQVAGQDLGYPEFHRVIVRDPRLFEAMRALDQAVAGRAGRLLRESLSLTALAGLLL